MNEREYCATSDLTRLRIVSSILHDMNYTFIDQEQIGKAVKTFEAWIETGKAHTWILETEE